MYITYLYIQVRTTQIAYNNNDADNNIIGWVRIFFNVRSMLYICTQEGRVRIQSNHKAGDLIKRKTNYIMAPRVYAVL